MNTPRDLKGAARLAADATTGLVDLVEAVHAGIASGPGLPAPADGRTRGITGLVYRSVRGVTRLVGGSVDTLLGLRAEGVAATDPAQAAAPGREALLAALNGVLGDHLVRSGNPLAIEARLRVDGLPFKPEAMVGSSLVMMVHGLCMSERPWWGDGNGAPGLAPALAAVGYTPLALHYNTGRPIADNGAALARLLEGLLAAAPVPVQRLVLVGHSMGGLVARSAVFQARQQGLLWPQRLSDLACLGSPHLGAPLEQLGHAVTATLAATPYAKPFARLARLRSAGITDLRHGRLLEDAAVPVPLPPGVRCWAIAGSLGDKPGALRQRVVGDGLVPLASALGQHADPARTLGFEPGHTWVGEGIGHLALLSHPAVHQQLLAWLGPAARPAG
jgi:pimeloyl-ACP methyl ester carboxylesterase